MSPKRTNVLVKKKRMRERELKVRAKMRAKPPQEFFQLSPPQGRMDTEYLYFTSTQSAEKKRIFKATEHLFSQQIKQSTLENALIKIYLLNFLQVPVSVSCETNFFVNVAVIYYLKFTSNLSVISYRVFLCYYENKNPVLSEWISRFQHMRKEKKKKQKPNTI